MAPDRGIAAVLIHDRCDTCQTTTDQELNTVALLAECVDCGHEVPVSETYARQMIED